tara:strand:+ start:274 stop:2088 length:1815 start_codon:yes stop_codon:yes gene_type:complete
MKNTCLVHRKSGSSRYFHFRGRIPKDLVHKFDGRKQFQISLKNIRVKEILLISLYLQTITENLFKDVRLGMKTLTIEDIKEILRIEIRKSIQHSHHVHLGTNKYNPDELENSLDHVSTRQDQLKKRLSDDLKGYERLLDQKLYEILTSLDIDTNKQTVNYKKLRRYFIDLYLLRYEFTRSLINESGKEDEDFKKEVENRLKLELFPDLSINPKKTEFSSVSKIKEHTNNLSNDLLSKHEMTPLSHCINNYINERGSIRTKSMEEIRHSLNLMIEDWGDIPVGSVNREMTTKFKSNIRNLPKNRSKNPKYRNKDFHEIVGMNINDKIHTTTINKHLGYCSSFYEWCQNHGYSHSNPFKGLKLKKEIRPRDERDRFSELELKQIFNKDNYIYYTKIKNKRYELYWVPLISLFSGMRLGEITQLYLDNIKVIKGNHRNKRWCFDIVVEPERTDKHIKNLSSRRIVPIHDVILDLGFLEFIQILKNKFPKRKRLFEELPYRDGNYNQNVSRFFNERYLPKLGLKTSKKNFHSFRHTVSDHLKQKGIEPHFINELLGHSSGNIDLERYGKGYNPDILYNKCVKKIVYQTSEKRSIDFKSLKVEWVKIIN